MVGNVLYILSFVNVFMCRCQSQRSDRSYRPCDLRRGRMSPELAQDLRYVGLSYSSVEHPVEFYNSPHGGGGPGVG